MVVSILSKENLFTRVNKCSEIATSVEDWPIEMRETSTTIDYELPHDITENTATASR